MSDEHLELRTHLPLYGQSDWMSEVCSSQDLLQRLSNTN